MLLVCALILSSTGSTIALASGEDVDARIENFDHVSGDYTVGDEVSGEGEVENTGTETHTFFVGYSLKGPDGEYYDNDGTTGRAVTLTPGEKTTVQVSMTLRSDLPFGTYDAITSVWRESDRDALHTRLDSVTKHDQITVEERSIEARILDFEHSTESVTSGDKTDGSITVENTGNTEHEFFVGYSVRGPNGVLYDNGGTTGRPVTLAPGETETVSVEWNVPRDPVTGEYDVIAAVWEESDRDSLHTKLADDEKSDQFEVVEPERVNARLSIRDIPSGVYEPGETVTSRIIVANTGNTEHEFFVGYSALGPEGASYDNNGQTGQAVELEPGETKTVEVQWTITEGLPAGEYDLEFAVWKESDRDDLATRLDSTIERDTITIDRPEEVNARILSFEPETATLSPGDRARVTVTIENTGDSTNTFFSGLSLRGPDDNWYDNDGSTGQPVKLDPGETTTVELEWFVEQTAPSGVYDSQVTVWKESDRDNLQTRLDSARELNSFSVERIPAIEVTQIDSRPAEATAGERVELRAVVRNTGSIDRSLTLDATAQGPLGFEYDLPSATTNIDAGATEEVTVVWKIPEEAVEAQYDVQITGTSEEREVATIDGSFADVVSVVREANEERTVTMVVTDEERRFVDGAIVEFGGQRKQTDRFGSASFRGIFDSERPTVSVIIEGDTVAERQVTLEGAYQIVTISVDTPENSEGIIAETGDQIRDAFLRVKTNSETRRWVPCFMADSNRAYYTSGQYAWYRSTSSCEDAREQNARSIAQRKGMTAGAATAAGNTVNEVKALLNDPVAYGMTTIEGTVVLATHPEYLKHIPEIIKEQQRRVNPYPANTAKYESFREGYYSGYLVANGVALYGGSAAQGSKAVKTASQTVKRVPADSSTGKLIAQLPPGTKAKIGKLSKKKAAVLRRTAPVAKLRAMDTGTARRAVELAVDSRNPSAVWEFIRRTDTHVAESTLRELDRDTLQYLFTAESGRAGRMRASLARHFTSEDSSVGPSDVDRFARQLHVLEDNDVPGTSRIVNSIEENDNPADSGQRNNVAGALFETRVTEEFAPEDIREIGRRIDTHDGDSEIDVLLKDGTIVEAKSGAVSKADLQKKITRFRQYQHRRGTAGDGVIIAVKSTDAVDDEINELVQQYDGVRLREVSALDSSSQRFEQMRAPKPVDIRAIFGASSRPPQMA